MRVCGVLLHPTSLPGRHGIGDLGDSAFQFADFLHESGQGLWQVLPLGPPAEANSPYKSCSSMAGNPLMISLDLLTRRDLLDPEDLAGTPPFPANYVDYTGVTAFKWSLLTKAAGKFFAQSPPSELQEFDTFCREQGFWLNQYAVFAALRDENAGSIWTDWRRRSDPDPEGVRLHKYVQFEFFRQWQALKDYCNERGIEILGDLPIFVAHDSADVWANPELFDLDSRGRLLTVAGVPPDYFSATGQLWGTPLYRWEEMARQGYRWWIDRIRCMLNQFNRIRLDHFRGFEKYYEIPADAQTALEGRWVEGPGDRFFAALADVFPDLPFIAEDLGLITQEVLALRDRWGFPGMRVLQFAFGDGSATNSFQPHNYTQNCVVYTGTHDNDTTVGWFRGFGSGDQGAMSDPERAEREAALRYLNSDGSEIHWDFIRAAVASVADTAIFPLQDVLGLGSEARMNLPAQAENNWQWRFLPEQLTPDMLLRLRDLCRIYGRSRA